MQISAYLSHDRIYLDMPLPDKASVLKFIAESFVRHKAAVDVDAVHDVLEKREKLMSTGIGGGIAIPHALSSVIGEMVIVLIRLKPGIPFEALDRRPVDVVFGLAIPAKEITCHLKALAGISALCKNPGMLNTIRSVVSPRMLWQQIEAVEKGMDES
ncbi:PTS sugar transporter subunit IIA [Desulfococcus multivorans]|uniref:Putative PTS IIA-like nitrogen-regulatory protein PtsN n=1 Tax=Desulfococcus multivorans DSM 2059 TaxID=1121405 RepID=S7U0U6_DESML|nr:PTS sugar transporter subunit IIA [Desulfococcus multivorans]AOY58833.1 PtsN: nitrogen regulatory protein (enzyme IIA-NTR) [Desulfococcus multivorans]AQV01119.1 hypothetical protein B2D07_10285 [Desulfococcus multivorans]EPR42957.1 putative PTS IIA-like nitrogen-regulatory protein PtsN [Desulfococcus multivorans DSM 2059]SJZ51259.1 PTS IIA-like nitrogen-regulatory protein PtsN [Desulfococcus multivorans DSM 2059]